MTTMLEKMARALAMNDGYSEAEINASLGDPLLDVLPLYTDAARAALQAIREVDEETFRAGETAMGGYNDCGPGEPWLAMIDFILNEPQP